MKDKITKILFKLAFRFDADGTCYVRSKRWHKRAMRWMDKTVGEARP